MKIVIILVVAVVVLLGGFWALGKFGVIPAKKMAQGNPTLAKIFVTLKMVNKSDLNPPAPPSAEVIPEKPHQPKKVEKPKPVATQEKPKDPVGKKRLAKIYSDMEINKLLPILAKMTDSELAELLEKMDDDKVGEILANLPTDRAVKMSRSIAAKTAALE